MRNADVGLLGPLEYFIVVGVTVLLHQEIVGTGLWLFYRHRLRWLSRPNIWLSTALLSLLFGWLRLLSTGISLPCSQILFWRRNMWWLLGSFLVGWWWRELYGLVYVLPSRTFLPNWASRISFVYLASFCALFLIFQGVHLCFLNRLEIGSVAFPRLNRVQPIFAHLSRFLL